MNAHQSIARQRWNSISTRESTSGFLGITPLLLNDTIYLDNRIPPRGFSNAAFEAIQSQPIAYSYADGQYWDDTSYTLPGTVKNVTVRLYYQGLSKEHVDFLLAENRTNSAGQDLYDAWVAHGRSQPVLMAEASSAVSIAEIFSDDFETGTLSAWSVP